MKAVPIWIVTCSIMIIVMVWMGGFTRLTNAGLSITEWRPISGILFPFSTQDWQDEWQKYKNSPEYRETNIDFAHFKMIYTIEYIHRLIGRCVGIIFFVPFIYFCLKKSLNNQQIKRLIIILLLGCFQGFMGWYMVKSGLANQPYVSAVRLAMHLLIAALIFALLWIEFLRYYFVWRYDRFALIMLFLVVLQMFFGGIVAGLDAGLIYNTFPLMGDHLVPDDVWSLNLGWLNFVHNPVTAQFCHRVIGMLLALFAAIFGVYAHKKQLQMHSFLYVVAIYFQVGLGIMTLINYVPVFLASLHQVWAFVVLSLNLALFFRKKI